MKSTKKIKRTNKAEHLATETRGHLYAPGFKEKSRKRAEDFTRKRAMSFEEVVLFMLISLKSSTQSALRMFFKQLKKPVSMKQQSFSEARAKIKVSAFVDLYQVSVKSLTRDGENKWNGYLVYAIDGSKIALPSDKKLLAYYGGSGRGAASPTAQGSVMYDVLNDIVVDARLEPLHVDERTLAKDHIDACHNLPCDVRKLLLFDRGYPCFELVEKLEESGLYYVMRVRSKFNKDIDAQRASDGYVELMKNGKRIRVRVIKLCLPSGEEETLITNIPDRRLGKKAFQKLYFLRWPVESKYDIVKNKLQLEHFNTRTVEGVQQDFYAAMYLTNFAAAVAQDAQSEIEQERLDKQNKYAYKANLNELIGILKDRFVAALTEDETAKQAALIQEILDEVTQFVVPVRPNRTIERKPTTRNVKFHHNKKYNC